MLCFFYLDTESLENLLNRLQRTREWHTSRNSGRDTIRTVFKTQYVVDLSTGHKESRFDFDRKSKSHIVRLYSSKDRKTSKCEKIPRLR